MKIVFLSCDSLEGFHTDDDLASKKLTESGHQVSTFPWTEDCDWQEFDCAVIRSTWDYVKKVSEFSTQLEKISKATRLLNSLEAVKWNLHKKYLTQLERNGVPVVPTLFFSHNEEVQLKETWKDERFVLKPAISASSFKTTVISREDIETGQIKKHLTPGDWMLQPFLPGVLEGEVSLVYFHKTFSHALIKIPKEGDFRVQEEFGGTILPYAPSPELFSLGEKVMSAVSFDLLYARVDVVLHEGRYHLMELELIEPSLYLRTSKDAPDAFAKAILKS